ncbi:hypothetical protein TPHA_0G01860 [Tetrapisispora phaffii CBS 4417]|uniref:Histone H1 n=1 Tax=Tetrapisispora phaffii (strain ATCC 24235 / CBS 4417 / NBRC 1672 / NRRL Y-8282 / UCD 70-5) TaxID=1071381 RepID=G8BVU4_TETPH|nr:hypothetical protein TPHA_0G01860 [Tetrapisispora phaffii CBS 4417]CCE64022.1 hypothetical protein TPHA_0G01860 [Tetrapisispora phaffii CBS 4417]
MAPKAVTKNTETSSKSYKDLITEALISLNDTKKGSSRSALKKYIEQNYASIYSSSSFDHHFNNAIKKGVETKDFAQPKGPSGSVKLVKKTDTAAKKIIKKKAAPAKKATPVKKAVSTKKVAPKPKAKVTTAKKAASPKSTDALTYKDMISNGIKNLNNGKGASRSALKTFIKDTYFQKKTTIKQLH